MAQQLHVLAVCGVGMGSSLILRMTVEEALAQLGVDASVENTDISAARNTTPDVIVGQEMHTSELTGVAPIIVTITDFIDTEAAKVALSQALTEGGLL